jgi:hypothetical protein
MKLTPNLLEWIQAKVCHYLDLLEYRKPVRIILTLSDYKKYCDQQRKYPGQHIGRSWAVGVCHRSLKPEIDDVIFLKVKKHQNKAELDHTIRHELLHLCKHSFNHYSPEFEKRVRALKQGKIENGRFKLKRR